MTRSVQTRWLVTGGIVAILLAGMYAAYPAFSNQLVLAYERAALWIDMSPNRAMRFGDRHLDSTYSAMYDIDSAEYFFNRAASLDPKTPYVFHQLARVSFLRGDFAMALARINFQISMHDDEIPSSYYVRGLIEGYMGRYQDAVRDYGIYLSYDPHNWAAINDYAWVLLKAGRFEEAHAAAVQGLAIHPENPWLLNSDAIALYELGQYEEALGQARAASRAFTAVTENVWLTAYPGNDPAIAEAGVAAFRDAIETNMHRIEAKIARNAVE